MRPIIAALATIVTVLCPAPVLAQQPDQPTTSVPRLVRLNGTFHPANGLPFGLAESATLSIYSEEQGGQPLWQETQNVSLDSEGHYTAMLGATQKDGVPVDLFSTGESRWLGIQFNRPGEVEQPRVQLVSVPYALKASDAETLGGKPASAYMLGPSAPATGTANSTTSPISAADPKSVKPHTTSATNYLPYFIDTSGDLGNSVAYQSGTSIGIDTTNFSAYGQTAALAVNGYANIGGLRLNGSDPYNTIYSGSAIAMEAGGNSIVLNPSGGSVGVASSNFSAYGQTAALAVKGYANIGGLRLNGSDPYYTMYSGSPIIMEAGGNSILLNPSGGSVGIDSSNFSAYGQTATLAVDGYANIGGLRLNGGDTLNTIYSGNLIAVSAGGNNILLNPYGGNVGVGKSAPGYSLDVAGDFNFTGLVRNEGNPLLQASSSSTNLALGINALSSFSTAGALNTAVGTGALHSDTSAGSDNTAVGANALTSNIGGTSNTAIGYSALSGNTAGSYNTAIGQSALGNNNGSNNIAVGYEIGSNVATGTYNIYIGGQGTADESNTIRIGTPTQQTAFYAAGISGVTVSSGVAVVVDSSGQLGIASSSRRFKEDIEDMGDASSGLMKLRPVTFRYKKAAEDGSKPLQYGLIAEEVAEVYPDLVAHSADGQIETVRYQLLDSMLLNELQKQQSQIHSLEAQNADLQDRLARLEAAMARMASEARDH
jgi:Chaperone of endosialidase